MSSTSSDPGRRAELQELRKLRPFTAVLRDGRPVRIRPIVPGDRRHLLAGLERMSPRSVYFRFHSPVKAFTEAELAYLTELDQHDHVAWGAEALDETGAPGIAVARYVRDAEDPTSAEAAIAVTDDYQGVGLGTILMETLISTALENGIEQLWGSILLQNEGAQRLFRRLGGTMQFQDGTLVGKIPVGWGYRTWRSSFPAAAGI
jgi:GNAT superfamily N-acetyltransferase